MASKRALAQKRLKQQQEMTARLETIERNQVTIMAALGIEEIPGVEMSTEYPTLDEQKAIDVYSAMSSAELEAEAKDRSIYDDIEGTGSNGNILKADLVAALVADDESAEDDE